MADGVTSSGQVIGGRWKPLMHLLEATLFRDTIVACGKDSLCYARNDGFDKQSIKLVLETWSLGSPEATHRLEKYVVLAAGGICKCARDSFPIATFLPC